MLYSTLEMGWWSQLTEYIYIYKLFIYIDIYIYSIYIHSHSLKPLTVSLFEGKWWLILIYGTLMKSNVQHTKATPNFLFALLWGNGCGSEFSSQNFRHVGVAWSSPTMQHRLHSMAIVWSTCEMGAAIDLCCCCWGKNMQWLWIYFDVFLNSGLELWCVSTNRRFLHNSTIIYDI